MTCGSWISETFSTEGSRGPKPNRVTFRFSGRCPVAQQGYVQVLVVPSPTGLRSRGSKPNRVTLSAVVLGPRVVLHTWGRYQKSLERRFAHAGQVLSHGAIVMILVLYHRPRGRCAPIVVFVRLVWSVVCEPSENSIHE